MMQKTRSFLGRLLRGSAVLAMAALVLPKLGAVKAKAVTYSLRICGIVVTDENRSDISCRISSTKGSNHSIGTKGRLCKETPFVFVRHSIIQKLESSAQII